MQRITTRTLQDTMYYQNVPIFVYKIEYPYFYTTCSSSAGQSINNYYLRNARENEQYCRTVLFTQAVDNQRYIQKGSPFQSYTFLMNFKITYNSGCITSLYTETYTYMGGAHGETKRTSDTWNFNTGGKLRLNDIYPITAVTLHQLHLCIEQQISARLSETPGSYFDNYQLLLRNTFNPDSFYLQQGGGIIYYQQYDIAPYSTGIPEFYIECRL